MTSNSSPTLVPNTGGALDSEDALPSGGRGPRLAFSPGGATTRMRGHMRAAARSAAAAHPHASVLGTDLTIALRDLEQQLQALHRRFDTLDRHAADLMFLLLSLPEMLYGKRREFSQRSRALLCQVVANPPYAGRCPCCRDTPVLTPQGRPAPGAEFDHVFHGAVNRPEHGWLICLACHGSLNSGGYLVRFASLPAFRTFQVAVLRQRDANRRATRDRTA